MRHWIIRDSTDDPYTVYLTAPGQRARPMHPRDAAKLVLRHGAAGDGLTWKIAGAPIHRTTVGEYRAVVRRRTAVRALKIVGAILLVLALAAPIAGWL